MDILRGDAQNRTFVHEVEDRIARCQHTFRDFDFGFSCGGRRGW